MGYKKMNIKTIKTDKAPQAIGPYSQAKVVNGFIYTSGQIPLKSDGSLVEGNFENECIQVLENIKSNRKCNFVKSKTIYPYTY